MPRTTGTITAIVDGIGRNVPATSPLIASALAVFLATGFTNWRCALVWSVQKSRRYGPADGIIVRQGIEELTAHDDW